MTETTTSRAAEVAGYLKQWMFDPNNAQQHPLFPSQPSTVRPTATRT